MPVKSISPETARALIAQGALLVDIRAADEYARERIANAQHIPMERLGLGAIPIAAGGTIIFQCQSGNRTRLNAETLAACSQGECYVLEGGLAAWKKAGLPVEKDASRPLELQRQVQIAAGSLVVLAVALGFTVSPWFYLVSGFIGAGLIFAGVSGFCGLARLLMAMPWNRRTTAA